MFEQLFIPGVLCRGMPLRASPALDEALHFTQPVPLRKVQAVAAPGKEAVQSHRLYNRLLARVIDAPGMRGVELALPRPELDAGVQALHRWSSRRKLPVLRVVMGAAPAPAGLQDVRR